MAEEENLNDGIQSCINKYLADNEGWKEQCRQYEQGLEPLQDRLLNYYYIESSNEFNLFMRDPISMEKKTYDRYQKNLRIHTGTELLLPEYIEILRDVIRNAPPLQNRLMVVRGISGILKMAEEGSIFSDMAFQSTSLDIEISSTYIFGGAMVGDVGSRRDPNKTYCCLEMKLLMPGTPCLYVEGEDQVILLPGTTEIIMSQYVKLPVYGRKVKKMYNRPICSKIFLGVYTAEQIVEANFIFSDSGAKFDDKYMCKESGKETRDALLTEVVLNENIDKERYVKQQKVLIVELYRQTDDFNNLLFTSEIFDMMVAVSAKLMKKYEDQIDYGLTIREVLSDMDSIRFDSSLKQTVMSFTKYPPT